ncbi:MAG: selenocysteine-specific translation elongation factor [Planctomycetes bacterium]|nr:selenocysteine-specific translation elongation factor [Planctomycetota bacterium]
MRRRYPGLLRPNVVPDVLMMVCTAGHVDHGKTQLVKLLTGCNTMHLKDEVERGMTIDLGFAPCVIGGEQTVGFVDVPGHEKLVRNMIAGVSGIGMTLLVVAADDGVMPQTIEHVQIMDLLGVRHGLTAVTKIDLAGPERAAEVLAEARAALAGTFLAEAPILPVSTETLEGFAEFYDAFTARARAAVQAQDAGRSSSAGVFRMPIINVFTAAGAGTVVTGMPLAGAVAVGDRVELAPGGAAGRERGMQRFMRDATEGGFGQCLALNVPDFGKARPLRGQVVCAPGCVKAAAAFALEVRAVKTLDRPLRNGEELKFHTGTSEVPGKLYLIDGDTLERGGSAPAAVVLQEAVGAAMGDRYILRRLSPAVTVGGGEILGVCEADERPRRKRLGRELAAQRAFFEGLSLASPEGRKRRVEWFLARERPAGAAEAEIARGTLLTPEAVKEHLAALAAEGKVLALGAGLFVHADAYGGFVADVRARIEAAPAKGAALSLTLSEVREGMNLPPVLWARIEDDLGREGVITRRGGKFVLEAAVSALGADERGTMRRLVEVFDEEGFASPRPDELPARLGVPPAEVERLLDHLCNEGALFRLGKNVVLSRKWCKEAQDKAVGEIKAKGILNSADFKYHLSSTRKYALAVLDWLDARRVTVRIGNDRRLAPGYERNLL